MKEWNDIHHRGTTFLGSQEKATPLELPWDQILRALF